MNWSNSLKLDDERSQSWEVDNLPMHMAASDEGTCLQYPSLVNEQRPPSELIDINHT